MRDKGYNGQYQQDEQRAPVVSQIKPVELARGLYQPVAEIVRIGRVLFWPSLNFLTFPSLKKQRTCSVPIVYLACLRAGLFTSASFLAVCGKLFFFAVDA